MWTDGWTDSHNEPDTRFSGNFEVANRVHFFLHVNYFSNHGLTFVRHGAAVLDNSVTVVVNCYNAV